MSAERKIPPRTKARTTRTDVRSPKISLRVVLPMGGLVLVPAILASNQFQETHEKLRAEATVTPVVVFFGESVTGFWVSTPVGFFPGERYVNRGLAG